MFLVYCQIEFRGRSLGHPGRLPEEEGVARVRLTGRVHRARGTVGTGAVSSIFGPKCQIIDGFFLHVLIFLFLTHK